mgnify:CR=1 FL=1
MTAITGVLVGLLCATTWAVGSVLIRDLAKKLDPFTLNAPRSLVGGLSMLLLTLITGRSADYGLLTADRLFYLLASVWVGGGIGDTLYVRSMTHIGVSRAFPIASIYPSFTLLMSLFFLQEQIDLGIIAGLLLVVLGVILVGRRTPSVASETSTAGKPWGVLFALLAAICWGTSAVLIAPGARGLDSIMVASIRVPALSLLLWGVVAARRTAPKLRTLSRKEWLILVIGGFVGWGLGSMLFVLSIMLLGPTRSAILTSTSPLFALPLSVVFLKERVTWLTVIGTLLAVVGVILVS